MAQWSRALLAVPPESLGSRQPESLNWPSGVRVREGLAGRDILVSSRTSDSCGGLGAVHANQVARYSVSSARLVRLASRVF